MYLRSNDSLLIQSFLVMCSSRVLITVCGSVAILVVICFFANPSEKIFHSKEPENILAAHDGSKENDQQQEENYNFMVFITISINSTHTQDCGGVLIAPAFVLTAAHCVDKALNAMSWLGIKDPGEVASTPFYRSKKLIVHEDYDNKTKENDIALIQLDEDIDFCNDIGLAKPFEETPYLSYPEDGTILKVLGYGVKNSRVDLKLLRTKFVTLDLNPDCDIYKNKESIIFTDAKNGPYEGDSGGPLLYQNYIIGIVSGEPCNRKSYTSVDYFKDWIGSNIVYNTVEYYDL